MVRRRREQSTLGFTVYGLRFTVYDSRFTVLLMSEFNRNLMHRWFNEVWNQGSVAAVDELLAEDAVLHGLADSQGNPVQGKDSFKGFHAQFRRAFPDIAG